MIVPQVFAALTDPAKMADWFYGMETGQAKVTVDLRPGGQYVGFVIQH
jgi:uncharacterized protein YndB with AHSA1/START domain